MKYSVPLFGGKGKAWSDDDRYPPLRVGDRMVPAAIFVKVDADSSNPELTMKIEVRQGIPVYTEIALKAADAGAEIRNKDLKNIYLDDWLSQIVAAFSEPLEAATDATDRHDAIKNIERVRQGRSRKSDEHLPRVAEVYRENFDGRPTDAVRRAFGVSPRTAARYVDAARQAGLLPPTQRGIKKV